MLILAMSNNREKRPPIPRAAAFFLTTQPCCHHDTSLSIFLYVAKEILKLFSPSQIDPGNIPLAIAGHTVLL